MRPFFTFYGGKWRAAPRYPAPVHNTIIEPFAGAAGYSVRHYDRRIVLIEKDPVIAALWRYLISATASDIRALPLLTGTQNVNDFDIAPAERSLIGFWLNKGTASPCRSPSVWMRLGTRAASFWGKEIREIIAGQVSRISHWVVANGDYSAAPDVEATWFIDPPYASAGHLYRYSSKSIDYPTLGAWCKTRTGQVLVCENDGAVWLPFKPFITIKSTEGRRGKGKSAESLWTNQ